MSKLIRKYVIPALVIALTGTGVSFAATGGVSSLHRHVPSVTNTDTTEVEPTPSDDQGDQNEQVTENANDNQQNGSNDAPESPGVVRSTDGCPEGFTGNHGQFVSQSDDKQAAAHSPCGKPVQSIDANKDKGDDNEAPEVEDHSGNDDQHESDQGAENEQHSEGHGHGDQETQDGGEGS